MIASNDITLPHLNIDCKEYTVCELIQKHQNLDNLSFFHLNCRSIKAHFDEISNLITQLNSCFPIMGLSETWITNDLRNCFSLPNYNCEFSCRKNDSPYGGVGLYIKNNIPYKIRDDLSSTIDLCESLWIEIPKQLFPSNKFKNDIIVAVIYRSPNSSLQDFLNYLENILNQLSLSGYSIVIMGDLNIYLFSKTYTNCMHCFVLQSWLTIP